jgi:hypothetical protein
VKSVTPQNAKDAIQATATDGRDKMKKKMKKK